MGIKSQHRTKWILLAGILTAFKLALYYHQVIAVQVSQYRQLSKLEVLNSIFFLDHALIIGASSLVIYITVIVIAVLKSRGAFSDRGKDSGLLCPVIIFIAVCLASAGLLIGLPWLRARFGMSYPPNPPLRESRFLLHPLFIRQCMILSVCLGLYFSDILTRSKYTKWINLIIFLAPLPAAQSFALLWWNVLDGFTPSKIWKPLLPVLAMASIILPISVFPISQPFGRRLPKFNAETVAFGDEINVGRSYCVERRPGSLEVYQRLDGRIQRLERNAEGQWMPLNEIDMGFLFNNIAFDFEKNEAYAFNGDKGLLYAVKLPSLRLLWKRKIPPEDFPAWTGYGSFIVLDNQRDVLYIADDGGNLIAVNRAGRTLASTYFKPDGQVSDLALIPDSGAVLALQNHRLTRLHPIDLKVESSIAFRSFAYGMSYDSVNRKIFVAFPKILKFGVYNPLTLELSGIYKAPAGVRLFEFDHQRSLMFAGSITGVVEIMDANDYKPIRRVRLLHWIHALLAIPETGELIATAGDIPPITWSYASLTRSFDFGGWFLEKVENIAREIVSPTSEWPSLWFEHPFKFTRTPDKSVLLVEENERLRMMGKTFLERMECRAILSSSLSEAMDELRANPPDLIILSADLVIKEGKEPKAVRREMMSLAPNASFAWTMNLKTIAQMPEIQQGENTIPKPFSFWNFAHVAVENLTTTPPQP